MWHNPVKWVINLKREKNPINESTRVKTMFLFKYAYSSMTRNRSRSLTLILLFTISVSIVSSMYIWTNTDSKVMTQDYFRETAYPIGLTPTKLDNPNYLSEISDSITNNYQLIESTDVVFWSYGIYTTKIWNNSEEFPYYPYSESIKDFQAFFVSNSFLERNKERLNITGFYTLENNTILVSKRFVEDYQNIFGTELEIGQHIDINIAKHAVSWGSTNHFSDFNFTKISDLKIVGIYNSEELVDLNNKFPSVSRESDNKTPIEDVLGWADSIILSDKLLDETFKSDLIQGGFLPQLLLRPNIKILYDLGFTNMPNTLTILRNKLVREYYVSNVESKTITDLEIKIGRFIQSEASMLFTIPAVIISIIFTVYASKILTTTRRNEVGRLRAKGATNSQIYGALGLEYTFIPLIGEFIGIILGTVFGVVIPSTNGFMQINFNELIKHINAIYFTPDILIGTIIIAIGLPIVISFKDLTAFLKTSVRETTVKLEPESRIGRGPKAAGIIAFILLVMEYFFMSAVSNSVFGDIQFIITLVIWILAGWSLSSGIRSFIRKIYERSTNRLGTEAILSIISMKRRAQKTLPLVIILTLIFSVSVFAITETTTIQTNNIREFDYYLGADYRITTKIDATQAIDQIVQVCGIERATAIVSTPGRVGMHTEFSVVGIDPEANYAIAHWDKSSLKEGNLRDAIDQMAKNRDTILIYQSLANALNLTIGSVIEIEINQIPGIGAWNSRNLTIVGILNSAPGLGFAEPNAQAIQRGFGLQMNKPFVIVPIDLLTKTLNIGTFAENKIVLAQRNPYSTDPRISQRLKNLDIVEQVLSENDFYVWSESVAQHKFMKDTMGILGIEFLTATVIGFVGLSVIMGSVISDRKNEIAILRAIGASRKKITKVIMLEFSSLVIASLTVGLGLGILLTYMIQVMAINRFPMPYVIDLIITVPVLDLTILFGLISIVSIWICWKKSGKAGELDVAQQLRNL